MQGLEFGGLEKMVVSLLLSLDPATYKARVICYDRLGTLAACLERAGIGVWLLERNPGVDLAYLVRLIRQLSSEPVDLLHLHNPTAFFYGAVSGWLAGVPAVVYTDHGRDLQSSSRNRLTHRFLSGRVDQVVAVSESVRRHLVEREGVPAARVMVIRNGISGDAFKGPNRRHEVRAELRLREDQPVVGVVGRLDPVKNHALLMRAMKRILDRLPAVRLLVIGDGPLRVELEALATSLRIKDHVAFLGNRADVPELLSAIDLFVLPSVSEGLSLTLIECCAAGKPAVATDVGGNREVVMQGETGLLVPSEDEKALAVAVLDLLTDARRSAAMGRAARRRFEAEFSLDTMVSQYRALYERVSGRAGSVCKRPDLAGA
jgi:sugar transferase (PEP-CTERM/EpsH1 system associated)